MGRNRNNRNEEPVVRQTVPRKGQVETDSRGKPGEGVVKLINLPCIENVTDAEGIDTLPKPSSRVFYTLTNRLVNSVAERMVLDSDVHFCVAPEFELKDDPWTKPAVAGQTDGTPAVAPAPRLTARDKFWDALLKVSNPTEKPSPLIRLEIDSAVNGNLFRWDDNRRRVEVELQTDNGRPAMRYFKFSWSFKGETSCFDLDVPIEAIIQSMVRGPTAAPIEFDDRINKHNRILIQARYQDEYNGAWAPKVLLVVKRPDFEEYTYWEKIPGEPAVTDAEGKVTREATDSKRVPVQRFRATKPGFAMLFFANAGLKITKHFYAIQRRVKPEIDRLAVELKACMEILREADQEFYNKRPSLLSGPEVASETKLELDYADAGPKVESLVVEPPASNPPAASVEVPPVVETVVVEDLPLA